MSFLLIIIFLFKKIINLGVGTKIDPTLCRADRLVGHVLGAVGNLPPIYTEICVKFFLLRRLLGVKTADKKQSKVQKLTKGEIIMVNIGSTSTGGKVIAITNETAQISLNSPACTEVLFFFTFLFFFFLFFSSHKFL